MRRTKLTELAHAKWPSYRLAVGHLARPILTSRSIKVSFLPTSANANNFCTLWRPLWTSSIRNITTATADLAGFACLSICVPVSVHPEAEIIICFDSSSNLLQFSTFDCWNEWVLIVVSLFLLGSLPHRRPNPYLLTPLDFSIFSAFRQKLVKKLRLSIKGHTEDKR